MYFLVGETKSNCNRNNIKYLVANDQTAIFKVQNLINGFWIIDVIDSFYDIYSTQTK